MRIVIHTGAHGTEADRLLKCLLNNKAGFAEAGTSVPGPGRYRTLLKDAFKALDGADPAAEARDVLMDALLDDETAERVILSNEHFFGSPRFAISQGRIYPLATRRLRQLQTLFRGDEIELFMGLASPATFVPAILEKASDQQRDEALAETDPRELRWSELVREIRAALPDVRLTLWCREDAPLIWAELIRTFGGLPAAQKIVGGFDLLSDIMHPEGMQRFRAYLARHPRLDEAKKRRVILAFLEKFAREDAIEEELDLPGWTEETVEELTAIYDRDVEAIAKMDGVRMILP